jgi:hypothetical protein
MNKLKTAAATMLVTSAIGVGGLLTAPTASAAVPARCQALINMSALYETAARVFDHYDQPYLAHYYAGKTNAYAEMALDCLNAGG